MNKIHIAVLVVFILAKPFFAGRLNALTTDNIEKVVLMTDRSIYITGEQIHFFATVMCGKNFNKSTESQILYSEIISPDGSRIAGSKLLISNSSAEGCLLIPGNLVSGTYYLRAYTKLMRNYGPEAYGYNQIRIINPDRVETLSEAEIQKSTLPQVIQVDGSGNHDFISVVSDKRICAVRDTISLTLEADNMEEDGIKSLCLSVIPANTQSFPSTLQATRKGLSGSNDYYTETRGLSISGKVTEISKGVAVNDKKVNLSIIGDGRDFMSARTDSLGRFFFALPDYSGSRDLFLCAEKMDSVKVKIWVDNDFNATAFRLPSIPFKLSETDRELAQNLAVNAQINAQYYNDTVTSNTLIGAERSAFYGKPTAIIYIDKYIQLPTLEEYFNELPSEVKVRKHKGQPHFAVLGSRGVSFYDPLVMVDWVAIDEPTKVLAVSPQNIQRIEVVKEDYIKGGQTYGGIISIISRKGDFAGIDLPSTGIFVNYQFLDDTRCISSRFDNAAAHPDSRNTVVWKPGITIPNGKTEKFNFTVPETPGKYNIVIQGITLKGEVFTEISDFEVKN